MGKLKSIAASLCFVAACVSMSAGSAKAVIIDFDSFPSASLPFSTGVEDGFNITVNFGPLSVNSSFIPPVSGPNQIHHEAPGAGQLQIDRVGGGLFTFDSLFSGGAFNAIDPLSLEGFLGGISQGVDVLGPGPIGSHALFLASNLDGVAIDTLFIDFGDAAPGEGPTHVDDIALTTLPLSVPEPVTLALFGFGVLGLGYVRRKRAS